MNAREQLKFKREIYKLRRAFRERHGLTARDAKGHSCTPDCQGHMEKFTLSTGDIVYMCRRSGAHHVCGRRCRHAVVGKASGEAVCKITGVVVHANIMVAEVPCGADAGDMQVRRAFNATRGSRTEYSRELAQSSQTHLEHIENRAQEQIASDYFAYDNHVQRRVSHRFNGRHHRDNFIVSGNRMLMMLFCSRDRRDIFMETLQRRAVEAKRAATALLTEGVHPRDVFNYCIGVVAQNLTFSMSKEPFIKYGPAIVQFVVGVWEVLRGSTRTSGLVQSIVFPEFFLFFMDCWAHGIASGEADRTYVLAPNPVLQRCFPDLGELQKSIRISPHTLPKKRKAVTQACRRLLPQDIVGLTAAYTRLTGESPFIEMHTQLTAPPMPLAKSLDTPPDVIAWEGSHVFKPTRQEVNDIVSGRRAMRSVHNLVSKTREAITRPSKRARQMRNDSWARDEDRSLVVTNSIGLLKRLFFQNIVTKAQCCSKYQKGVLTARLLRNLAAKTNMPTFRAPSLRLNPGCTVLVFSTGTIIVSGNRDADAVDAGGMMLIHLLRSTRMGNFSIQNRQIINIVCTAYFPPGHGIIKDAIKKLKSNSLISYKEASTFSGLFVSVEKFATSFIVFETGRMVVCGSDPRNVAKSLCLLERHALEQGAVFVQPNFTSVIEECKKRMAMQPAQVYEIQKG